ncbi:hypothetical protein Tco_0798500 [Tanacetum coccineum]
MTSITAQQTKFHLKLVPKENRLDIGKRQLEEPTIPGHDFDALLSEEDTLSLLRDLGHTRVINSLNDVVIDQMHQPWRTFTSLINRSLSRKTCHDKLHLIPRIKSFGQVLCPPNFARNFKKASPSKKDSDLVPVDEEPVKKGKRLKTPAKKSTSKPATGIVIREPPVETKSKRKEKEKRLRRQDIEDMLLLLVQGKLTNLSLDDRYALNVALRMYTRRIVIQEHMEDLQLAVESYQKKINLTRPDTTRHDLRKMTPYTGYPDVQGIIYQDDLSRNWLMRTDELQKFSDATLNHVCTTLNDIATGIQMDYLPKKR